MLDLINLLHGEQISTTKRLSNSLPVTKYNLYCHIRKNSPLVPVLKQMYIIQTVIEMFPYTHFSIAPHLHVDFPNVLFLSRFPTKFQCVQCHSHTEMCASRNVLPPPPKKD